MTQNVRIELRLLLPEVVDHRDACVARLEARLAHERGLTHGQVIHEDGKPAFFSVNYEPAVISLAEVERLARAAGAEIHDQYGHVTLKIRAVTSEDTAPEIEAALRAVPGVVGASVSLVAQLAQVEFNVVEHQLCNCSKSSTSSDTRLVQQRA
jgi:Zn2+/Cd2+-exporting ATPase